MDPIIIFCAKYLIVIVIFILMAAWFKTAPKKRFEFLGVLVIAAMIALLLTIIAWALYFHQRPFVAQNIEPLVGSPSGNSFPSRHTLIAMTMAVVIYYYHRRLAVIAFVLTLLIGVGRVLAHVHWPIDIIGGLIIGAISGVIGYALVQRFNFLRPKQPTSRHSE